MHRFAVGMVRFVICREACGFKRIVSGVIYDAYLWWIVREFFIVYSLFDFVLKHGFFLFFSRTLTCRMSLFLSRRCEWYRAKYKTEPLVEQRFLVYMKLTLSTEQMCLHVVRGSIMESTSGFFVNINKLVRYDIMYLD
jgi:hypothetical protein